jgi:hypothetical protein
MNNANLHPKEVEKLIGGYATGTLTDSERNALFAEALNNQALFDALADEEALRELLEDPVARRQLLATLEQKPATLLERFTSWISQPLTMGLAAGVAAAGLAVVIVPRIMEKQPEQVAMTRPASTPSDPGASQPIPEQDKSSAPATPKAKASTSVKAQGEPDVQALRQGPSPAPPAPRAAATPASPNTLSDASASSRERKAEQEGDLRRRADTAQAVPAPAPPPPPPASAAPKVSEPQQQAPAPAREQQEQVQVQALTAKSSVAMPPFEYTLERQGRDGNFAGMDATARVDENEQIRVAIQTNRQGTLLVDLRMPGGTARSLFRASVRPGMRFHVPAQGGLPAGRGEHRLVMSYLPVDPGQTQPMGFRQGGAAVENRARKEGASRDATVGGAAAEAAAPYTVEIPIRFR